MPIVNSVFKSKNSFASEFFCPHCLATRPYELKAMSEEILLLPFPGLSTSDPAHVVECRACHYAFDPEILTRNIQSLIKLTDSVRSRLDKGVSPGFLKLEMLSDGLNESFAEQLIHLALR
jgi:hypothetical protein